MPAGIVKPLITVTRPRPIWAFSPLFVLASCAGEQAAESAPTSTAAVFAMAPGVAPRLSAAPGFRVCTESVPEGGTIPRAECPATNASWQHSLGELSKSARQSGDGPAAEHLLALIDLVWDDARGNALDRSIAALRPLVESGQPSPAIHSDYAAALIVRAERRQTPRDLLEAYEYVERAVAADPRNPAARYNLALALDRSGLVDQSTQEWRAYLAIDSTSGWAGYARRRLEYLATVKAPPPPAADAPAASYARYAIAEPQAARELGMNRLLGEWAAAVAAGDAATASERLARAAALGDALRRRPGGDASLADAVAAIRSAAGNPAAARMLARAHREYAAGVARFNDGDVRGAAAGFVAALDGSGASPALRGWATVYLAASRADKPTAEPMLRQLLSADDFTHYPALVARARWTLASILTRDERWEPALVDATAAARSFARLGEREHEGAALNTVIDARFVLGEPDSAYAAVHRALGVLAPYRTSVRLHNLLLTAADEVAADGLLRSALRIQDEDVAASAERGHPFYVIESHLARARLLAEGGESARAAADVAVARPLVAAIPPGGDRDYFAADLRRTEAAVSLREDPRRAAAALDSAAGYWEARGRPFLQLQALIRAAEARLASGDVQGATRTLEVSVRMLDRRRDSIRMEPRRAAVFDAARGVVDRMVMLKLAEGRAAEALDYLDRGRASLAPAGGPADAPRAHAPRREVMVVYARVADTLLAWTVAGERVEVARSVVDTVQLAQTLRDLDGRFEDLAPEEEVLPGLSRLYDLLIGPIAGRLGGAETPVVVIADGEVASVPFAALYDARRGRYLGEDHPLRFAVSLREARRRPFAGAAAGVLLVADPAFDAREHPGLDRLRQAEGEVLSIARAHPGAEVLEGPRATHSALQTALPRAGIAHFAGHAVFDDQRPERSYLVLAPSAEKPGRITARELAGLDLRHVRVVVLSACRTVRSGRNRAGGFTGLAGALLAAGAGGTVGSTWEVNDSATATLMAEFHRAYRESGDGPRALRTAQLSMLRSRNPRLRTPSSWAGFRYVGR